MAFKYKITRFFENTHDKNGSTHPTKKETLCVNVWKTPSPTFNFE